MSEPYPDRVLRDMLRVKPGPESAFDERHHALAQQLLDARTVLRRLASDERWSVYFPDGQHARWAKECWDGNLPQGAMGVIQDAQKLCRALLPEHQEERSTTTPTETKS